MAGHGLGRVALFEAISTRVPARLTVLSLAAWKEDLTVHPQQFSAPHFLEHVRATAEAIGAPYSEAATQAVLDAYGPMFAEGAVLWRATDRPGGDLNYRFYARRSTDTVAVARRAGFIAADDRLGDLVQAWNTLYDGTPEQSCDFDAARGLTKTWLYLGGTRPVGDVLAVEPVPLPIRERGPLFHSLGLDFVRHVCVDYDNGTVNLYFRARGPLTEDQCRSFTALAGAAPPDRRLYGEMATFLSQGAYTFSVTLSPGDGAIERVAFYALKLPEGSRPTVGDRLTMFFEKAPSFDPEEMNAVAWSFGSGSGTYIKAERSYCGDLVSLIKGWNTFFSQSETTDPALTAGGEKR
ncbi:aromatic prenyltransferase [Streptomyces sp. NPDC046821]|uniref:aromatic prenyltransferase n=1 Tax=Streptomyces sp. NPDC046821 TaxID=3154702 RepID=UPI0033FF5214